MPEQRTDRPLARFRRTITTATAAVAVAASVLAMTGCGTSGPTNPATSGTATLWALTGNDQKMIQNSIDAWNSGHPDKKVEATFFANEDYKTKIRTAIGAGQAPTMIFGWGGGIMRDYAEAGAIEQIDDVIEPNKDKYLPAVLANGQVDGKTYGVPLSKINPLGLYYNKQIFDDAGVKPPTTWDEVMKLVPVFKNKGIAPLGLGGKAIWPEMLIIQALTDRIGGPKVFENVLKGKPDAWSHPAIKEALTKVQELVKAEGFVSGFSSIASQAGSDMALIHTGKAAMIFQLSSQYGPAKTAAPEFVSSGKLGFVPFPAVTGGTGTPSDVQGAPSNFFYLSSKASEKQKETAKQYLKEGLFTDAYVKDMLAGGTVPPLANAAEAIKSSPDASHLQKVHELAAKAPSFQLSWDQALSPEAVDALFTNTQDIFLLKSTPEQFQTNMNATIK